MESSSQNNFGNVPQPAAPSGKAPNDSEGFRNVPNASEKFGSMPHGSETFREVPKPSETLINLPNVSERKETHIVTVREAARMFEAAGVARTERSIVNWCQPNKLGVPRLDSYFDPNERRYYLTPESVQRAIHEEVQRAATKGKETVPAAPLGTVPKPSETNRPVGSQSDVEPKGRIKDLENEVMDLKITNRAKDYFLEQMKNEREGMLKQLLSSSQRVGELETKLLRLTDGHGDSLRASGNTNS